MGEESKDFVVKDRRIFSETESDAEPEKKAAEKPPEPEAQAAEAPKAPPPPPEQDDETAQLPEINFATFIFSLNSSVLVHLGLIEDPSTGQKTKRLPLAKQTIDILGMLEEKTKGNLSKDEETMLKNILYDLRILYVKEKG